MSASLKPREAVNDILEDIRGYAKVAAGMSGTANPLAREAVNDILEDIRDYMKLISEGAGGGGGGGGTTVIISDTPPPSPALNSLWFDSVRQVLFIYYNDGNSSQWVQTIPSVSGIADAPNDGTSYGRKNQTWVPVT